MKVDLKYNEKQLQFQFDLQIQKISLLTPISIPKSTYLEVIWRRGQKNITTINKPQITGAEKQITFKETLSMISTCILNTDTNHLTPKDSVVSVVIYIAGSQKLFGSVNINLSDGVTPNNWGEKTIRVIEEDLNGRAKARISLKLSGTFLKQKAKGDEISVGSGVHSQFHNNSNFSSDRRLGDIPAKDTYSVMSYGGVRYSGKKQDGISLRRDDSSKKSEDQSFKDYGRFGSSQQNYYTKPSNEYNLQKPLTAPLSVTAQGSSNIKSITSIQSSANRVQRNSDSQHNRSGIGEQSSRLLIEQQTRRSKLEAEVTKNKVENEQIKNKLAQFVKQNMRIKEQLKIFQNNTDNKQAESMRERDELKDRNYMLTQQIQQLKTRFQTYISIQKQNYTLKQNQEQNRKQIIKFQQNSQQLTKQIEAVINQLYNRSENQGSLSAQISKLRLQRGDFDKKTKQFQQKIKDVNQQVDYYQKNCKNLSQMLRQSQERNRSFQRDQKSQQLNKMDETRRLNQLLQIKQNQLREIIERLSIKNMQYNRLVQEHEKQKQEQNIKTSQLQKQHTKTLSQVELLNHNLKDKNYKIVQLQNEKNIARADLMQKNKQIDWLKQNQHKNQQMCSNYERQLQENRKLLHQLEIQNQQLNKVMSDKAKSMNQFQSLRNQLDALMKQNLHLQLEIKYKTQQCNRYGVLQEELQNAKCRLVIQEGNHKEIYQALEKTQKDLKDKHRAYTLQCQKSKILVEERLNFTRSNNQLKDELEAAQVMIGNGQRQFEHMKDCLQQLESRNANLQVEIRNLQNRLQNCNPDKHAQQINGLQYRIRELEYRESQKIKSLETLNRNLLSSGRQIKELQNLSEQRCKDGIGKDKIIADQEQKIKQLQVISNSTSELEAITQEKNNVVKKNEMLMQQLFSYKRKFQQERGRSTSVVQSRNSEDYLRMKNLENQLQKRDDRIRKMEKQMMVLENENVNLSIQVMKKLQDYTPN